MTTPAPIVPGETKTDARARVGAGGRLRYRDPRSGHLILITTPSDEPDLWEHYLDLDQIQDVRSTSLFFVAFGSDGDMVGGVRSQGPYTDAGQSHAVLEWEGEPQQPLVHAMIEERLPFGVVESKAAWVSDAVPGRRELVECLSRVPVHAAMVLGARFALGTSAVHTLDLWTATGAVVAAEVDPVCYPDERYRTSVLWWDRWTLADTAAEVERLAFEAETAQLLGRVPSARVSGR